MCPFPLHDRLDALGGLPLIGADLMEVAPPLDRSEITSFLALKLVMEILGLVRKRA